MGVTGWGNNWIPPLKLDNEELRDYFTEGKNELRSEDLAEGENKSV